MSYYIYLPHLGELLHHSYYLNGVFVYSSTSDIESALPFSNVESAANLISNFEIPKSYPQPQTIDQDMAQIVSITIS